MGESWDKQRMWYLWNQILPWVYGVVWESCKDILHMRKPVRMTWTCNAELFSTKKSQESNASCHEVKSNHAWRAHANGNYPKTWISRTNEDFDKQHIHLTWQHGPREYQEPYYRWWGQQLYAYVETWRKKYWCDLDSLPAWGSCEWCQISRGEVPMTTKRPSSPLPFTLRM